MSVDHGKYDEVLTSILVNEKSILGFLSSIFKFLARRTDFYYVPQDHREDIGFPPGVAEEIVVKVLRSCDPKNWKPLNGASKPADNTEINNEIMCSTVAHEVEVITDEVENIDIDATGDNVPVNEITDCQNDGLQNAPLGSEHCKPSVSQTVPETQQSNNSGDAPQPGPLNDTHPVIPTQKNSESYNGAEVANYSWSQTIMELDVAVKLPSEIKSSKDLKISINPGDICIMSRKGDILVKDSFPYKIKTLDSFWTMSEEKLLIHLEKVQERWWTKLLNSEEDIDLSKIDCSRDLYELPDDHIQKVREMQWNQEQKMKGLPTSDQLKNIDILKKAWNAEGSPFKGKEFDPTVLQNEINM